MSKVMLALGTVLTCYGLGLFAISNLNFGVIAVILLGMLVLSYGIFRKQIADATKSGIFKYIKIFVIALVIAEGALVGFLAAYGACDNVTYREDAVIVLGAGIRGDRVTLPLKYRLDKAVEYIERNPGAVIVVTGGRGFQETVTEAYAMEKYLIGKGVEPGKIIKEEKATSTNENMRFSKELLDKRFGGEYSVAVITNGFHIYRGVAIAEAEGLEDVTHMHAGLQWYNLLPCYLRESAAVLKLWLLG